jgi:ABC-type transporter Mla maintaining outer membrane lipid asymmetry ATPase subunit MlaF
MLRWVTVATTITIPQRSTFNKTVEGSEFAVTVQGLTKKYRDLVAVNQVSFDVKRGEIFSLLGPNGAGKPSSKKSAEN